MALKSGFYNAFEVDGVYDRTYSADEYTDFYAAFLTDGVRRSNNDDLKCTAAGLIITVAAGYAICGSKWVHNESAYELPAVVPPVGSYSRIDRVFLHVDTTEGTRAASFVYREGTPAANPTPPAKSSDTGVFELCLANVTVAPNALSVTIQDTRAVPSLCGWVKTPIDQTMEYNYICNGATDNEDLAAFLESKRAAIPANGSIKVNVFGTFGITNPVYPLYVFSFTAWGNRKIILDFANCSPITLVNTGNFNNFIYATNPIEIYNLNASLSNVGNFFSQAVKKIYMKNCRVNMTMNNVENYAVFAYNGTFENCVINITNGVCFLTVNDTKMIRVIGCECYAYGTDEIYYSGYVLFASQNVPVVTNQLICPTVAVEGFTQKKAIHDHEAGTHASYTDTITALTIDAEHQNVNGTIPLSLSYS